MFVYFYMAHLSVTTMYLYISTTCTCHDMYMLKTVELHATVLVPFYISISVGNSLEEGILKLCKFHLWGGED